MGQYLNCPFCNPVGTAFKGNALIEKFNEFKKFTGFTTVIANAFNGCTNLQSIDITGKETLGDYAFQNCKSLSNLVGLMAVTVFGRYSMAYMEGAPWPGSRAMVIGNNVTYAGDSSLRGYNLSGNAFSSVYLRAFIAKEGGTNPIRFENSSISCVMFSLIDLPSNTSYIGPNINQVPGGGISSKRNCSFVIRCTTPPDMYSLNAFAYFNCLYVPANFVDAYKNSWPSMANKTYAIGGSEWTAEFGSSSEYADYDFYGVSHP